MNRILIFLLCLMGLFQECQQPGNDLIELSEKDGVFDIRTNNYRLQIEKNGFRYNILSSEGLVIAPAHEVSGLQISKEGEDASSVSSVQLTSKGTAQLIFEVITENGIEAEVILRPEEHHIKMTVTPKHEGAYSIVLRTAGVGPAYGMADHAAIGEGKEDLVLRNFVRDPLIVNHGQQRMISNFVICPQQGMALVNMEPGSKVIRITDDELTQGAKSVRSIPAFYYFIGTPKEIYQSYLDTRHEEGYSVYKPKHEWFGVGWEAFGALAWRTNQKTVTENVDKYLEYGYPLNWMVVGSGFWPRGTGEFDQHGTPYGSETASEEAKKLQATTSFGMWDSGLYPDPKGLIDHFHQKGLIFNIGLRIGFIPGGPFTGEGLENGYFLKNEKGEAKLFKIGFPRTPIHLLDAKNAKAVVWYTRLCEKWLAYGIDGFKEDLFSWPKELPDDLIDPVNRALMNKGVHIMGRCNYLGSPADIHRFDDFNYNQVQDRGPINGLSYAFSGFPNVYPDIIGGTGLATGRFGKEPKEKLKVYLVRYAQYASLNPSMAFGFGPWNFDEETNQLCLQAAQLHNRLKPYIFSNAIKAYQTGYPYPVTPLPLAYPNDQKVYGLADTTRKGYQWLIGESLLAAPLYGDDYDRSNSRDIYLPSGKWMDYETGTFYEGGQTLEDFDIPLQKIPLFVGGNGFLVEQDNGKLYGRVYPLGQSIELDYWGLDGQTKSQVNIEVKDWNNPIIKEKTSGKEVPYELVRHAFQFELEAGKDYLVE